MVVDEVHLRGFAVISDDLPPMCRLAAPRAGVACARLNVERHDHRALLVEQLLHLLDIVGRISHGDDVPSVGAATSVYALEPSDFDEVLRVEHRPVGGETVILAVLPQGCELARPSTEVADRTIQLRTRGSLRLVHVCTSG